MASTLLCITSYRALKYLHENLLVASWFAKFTTKYRLTSIMRYIDWLIFSIPRLTTSPTRCQLIVCCQYHLSQGSPCIYQFTVSLSSPGRPGRFTCDLSYLASPGYWCSMLCPTDTSPSRRSTSQRLRNIQYQMWRNSIIHLLNTPANTYTVKLGLRLNWKHKKLFKTCNAGRSIMRTTGPHRAANFRGPPISALTFSSWFIVIFELILVWWLV